MQVVCASTCPADAKAAQRHGAVITDLFTTQPDLSTIPQRAATAAPATTSDSHADAPEPAVTGATLPAVDAAAAHVLAALRLDNDDGGTGRPGAARPGVVMSSAPAGASLQLLPDPDMLVLHLRLTDLSESASTSAVGNKAVAGAAALEWTDALLRQLNSVQALRDRVILHVVTSFGETGLPDGALEGGGRQLLSGSADDDACAAVCRPRQSWEFSGLEAVQTDAHRPIMVAGCLRGTLRRDRVERYHLGDMLAAGGLGCILVDRLIHEIAYKVARAPKYGS